MIEVSYRQAVEQAKQVQAKILRSIPDGLIVEEDNIPIVIGRGSKKDCLGVLARLYKFSDRINATFSKHITCGKGCHYCCSLKKIQIFELEVLFIQKYAKKKPRDILLVQRDFEHQACPFLVEGCCEIYSHRPYACRKHFSMVSARWCQPETGESFKFPMLVFDGIERGLFTLSRIAGKERILDIRQVFEAE